MVKTLVMVLHIMEYSKILSSFENDNKFFVIVGAMDGVAHDALFPFAFKNKSWSGLLIEPIKFYFDQLKVNYENRDNLIFENVAITDELGPKDIYTIPQEHIQNKTVPSWCDGISTFNLERSAISYDGIKDKIVTEQVQCCPFEDLVQKHDIKNIDILQIDAEGNDLVVLNQVWSLGFRPQVIYIEIVQLDQNQKDFLFNLLQSNNYKIKIEGDNLLAEKKQEVVTLFPKRKRVAFYTYSEWAFGAIHSALCKELYKYDIDADILDWNKTYSEDDWKDFIKLYDVFATVPGKATTFLLNNKVPYEKIAAIAHGKYDIEGGVHYKNDFNAFASLSVIASPIVAYAREHGIQRDINVLRNGIHFDRFYQKTSQSFTIIGYAGALNFYNFDNTKDCKRSYLMQQIAQKVCLPIITAQQLNYIRMPSFYSRVDSVCVSSDDTEACGLPLMEAAAAGRLPISAKIGITKEFDNPPGLILPLEDKDFVEKGIENILELMNNPVKFKKLCEEAQAFAHDNYDWKHVAHLWANVLNNV